MRNFRQLLLRLRLEFKSDRMRLLLYVANLRLGVNFRLFIFQKELAWVPNEDALNKILLVRLKLPLFVLLKDFLNLEHLLEPHESLGAVQQFNGVIFVMIRI